MKRCDVRVGGIYIAKISGRLCRVRLDDENEHTAWGNGRQTTYWLATNLETGRSVKIHSAAKLRREIHACKTCGIKEGMGGGVTLAPDPYAEEINNDPTPVWMCQNCRTESAREI